MILERFSSARGHSSADWLDSRHAFSSGRYYDPAWMGFGALRVVNEDRVAPGAGFAPHRHANMEILSYVLDGALAHRIGDEQVGTTHAGELWWIGAGHGTEYSARNASDNAPAHYLQMWIQPDRLNAQPAHAQRALGENSRGRWTLLASPGGAEDSIAIRQDARLSVARLDAGDAIEHPLLPQRRYWLQVARGAVEAAGRKLQAGDALGVAEEAGALTLTATEAAEILLIDLP